MCNATLPSCVTRVMLESCKDDLESYFRCLRLKELFLDEDGESQTETEFQFRPGSTWMPLKSRDTALETYITKVRNDVERHLNIHRKRCMDNLTSEERRALRDLRCRTDIIIKPADKGSAIVVLGRDDYITEAKRQLDNEFHYRKIKRGPYATTYVGD